MWAPRNMRRLRCIHTYQQGGPDTGAVRHVSYARPVQSSSLYQDMSKHSLFTSIEPGSSRSVDVLPHNVQY